MNFAIMFDPEGENSSKRGQSTPSKRFAKPRNHPTSNVARRTDHDSGWSLEAIRHKDDAALAGIDPPQKHTTSFGRSVSTGHPRGNQVDGSPRAHKCATGKFDFSMKQIICNICTLQLGKSLASHYRIL